MTPLTRWKPFHLLRRTQSWMAISEACPLPPASGLLDIASFAAIVDAFFTNRLTIAAKEAYILRFQWYACESNKNLCPFDLDMPPLKIIKQLKKKKGILNNIFQCLLSTKPALSWIQRLRPDPVHGEGCEKDNMSTDAYSTLKSSAMDGAAVHIYYGNEKITNLKGYSHKWGILTKGYTWTGSQWMMSLRARKSMGGKEDTSREKWKNTTCPQEKR